MRTSYLLLTAALLMTASPALAQAPTQTPAPAGQPAPPAFTGTLDLGGLFTSTEGDEARYERYRDTRDGVYSSFSLDRSGDSYLFDGNASHVGYRDQRYNARFLSRRVNLRFNWTSLPLNFSYLTQTPFVTNGSTLSLDDAAQRAVQGPRSEEHTSELQSLAYLVCR